MSQNESSSELIILFGVSPATGHLGSIIRLIGVSLGVEKGGIETCKDTTKIHTLIIPPPYSDERSDDGALRDP